MEKKWNLQDIKPASPRRKRPANEEVLNIRDKKTDMSPEMEQKSQMEVGGDDNTNDNINIEVENGNGKKRTQLLVAFSVFFLVVAGGFLVSFLTGGAEVTVEPRHREPNVNATFEAFRTPQVGELSYEIMRLEAEGERQVSATGQEEVKELATGEITIYKKTPEAERLIKNTRFESPGGLVFRITESVVVPGAVENASGDLVPGSIKAEVFADDIGEQYNLAASTNFTVPGFKEGGYDELYASIYAENDEAFTGGFEGLKFIIDDKELETTKQSLQMELRDSLLSRVPEEKPSGFVVFDSATTFTYESLPAVEYGDNLATIKERALLQIPIFKDADFASYIAEATVPGYENEPVRIDNLTDINFTYTSATTTNSDIGNVNSVSFKLTGKPQLVWTFDEGKLTTDLLGAPKTALTSILGAYPAIEKAEAVVRPFWKRSFPTDMDEIQIIEKIER